MAKKREVFFPEKKQEKFEFFFLSALLSLLSFRIFLSFYSFTGEGHLDEFGLYFWGWLVFMPTGLLECGFLEKVRRRWRTLREFIYGPLLFVDFLLLLLFYTPSNWGRDSGWTLLLYFVSFQAGGVTLASIFGRPQNRLSRLNGFIYLSMGVLSVFWLARTLKAFDTIIRNGSICGYGFVLLVSSLFYFGIPHFSRVKNFDVSNQKMVGTDSVWKKLLSYSVAFLLIVVAVIDPRFEYDRSHCSFFLGPLADLAAGKSLLVDINAQYGVLVFHFLSLFFHFLPLGFTSFTLVYTILLLLEYLLFFFIVRMLFRLELLSFFCLVAFLLLNYFGPQGYATCYPSTGPLRFGPFYFLTALVLLRNRFVKKKETFFFLESLVAGISFFWSFEVCIYTFPAYFCLLIYECLDLQTHPQLDLTQFKKRSRILICCVIFAGVLVYLDVFLRSGHLPDWSLYFDLIFKYVGGFGKLSLPLAGYWWVIVAILFFSFFVFLGCSFKSSIKEKTPMEFNVAALLIFGGIAQFLYFLSRPASDNLCHICMPSLLLLVYWLYLIRRLDSPTIPEWFKRIFYALAVLFLGLYLQAIFPQALQKMQGKALPFSKAWKNFSLALKDMPRNDAFAQKAEKLFEKYSGTEKFLVYLFGEKGLEVSLYTGRFKVYPYNDVTQAGFCDPVLKRIILFEPHLKPGNVIYLSEEILENFEPRIYQKIKTSFHLKLVESSNGIYVYRLLRPRNGTVPQ